MDKNLSDLQLQLREIARAIAQAQPKLVLAESCTGGLIAATLTQTEGASAWFYGSFVTYTNDAKRSWLGIPPAELEQFTAVSPQVAESMAHAALTKTPAAIWAAAVTGYLGPAAPPDQDGLIFIAIAERTASKPRCECVRHVLPPGGRSVRQADAALRVLKYLHHQI